MSTSAAVALHVLVLGGTGQEVDFRRHEALAILGAQMEYLAQYGVQRLALIGSVARDEARPDSDVDLLIEFSRPVGLFTFVQVKEYLGQVLGRRVDLVTPAGLKRQLRDRILEEAVRVGEGVAAPR
jgi:predicted nucleotidyltransferase